MVSFVSYLKTCFGGFPVQIIFLLPIQDKNITGQLFTTALNYSKSISISLLYWLFPSIFKE